jgi:hypothetical protein
MRYCSIHSCSFSRTDLYSIGLFFRFSNFPQNFVFISRDLKRRTRGGSGRGWLGGGHGIQRWGRRSSLVKVSRRLAVSARQGLSRCPVPPANEAASRPIVQITIRGYACDWVSIVYRPCFQRSALLHMESGALLLASWSYNWFLYRDARGTGKGCFFTHVICRLWSS